MHPMQILKTQKSTLKKRTFVFSHHHTIFGIYNNIITNFFFISNYILDLFPLIINYLRLKLPGEIVENDSSSGSYDCDAGTFVLKFDKVIKGEYFKDLDMITTLLAPPREPKNIVPTIEVIG